MMSHYGEMYFLRISGSRPCVLSRGKNLDMSTGFDASYTCGHYLVQAVEAESVFGNSDLVLMSCNLDLHETKCNRCLSDRGYRNSLGKHRPFIACPSHHANRARTQQLIPSHCWIDIEMHSKLKDAMPKNDRWTGYLCGLCIKTLFPELL